VSMSQSHCPVPGALQASSGRPRARSSLERSSAHTASKPQRPGLAQRVEHRVLRGIAICVSPGPGALRAVWRHGVAAPAGSVSRGRAHVAGYIGYRARRSNRERQRGPGGGAGVT